MNILAYGETTLDGDMNITPYFEAMYNTYEVNQNSGEGQLFPNVPALNPYNLCNPNQPNGVDCGLAYGAYLDNPGIQQLVWINSFGAPAAFFRDVLGLSFVAKPPLVQSIHCQSSLFAAIVTCRCGDGASAHRVWCEC